MTQAPETPDTECQDTQPNYPTLTIDWDLYGEYLEESDLSDDEKRELIQTVWNIVVSFVDLGFGIESVQCAEQDKQINAKGDHHAI